MQLNPIVAPQHLKKTGNLLLPVVTTAALGPAAYIPGLAAFTVGSLLYPDTTTTIAQLLAVGVNQVLVSGGIATAPAWSGTPTLAGITCTAINPLTTAAESWVGPSAAAGIYFKGGNVGIGTTNPGNKLEIAPGAIVVGSGSMGAGIYGFGINVPSNKYVGLQTGSAGSNFNFENTGTFAIYGATSFADQGLGARNYILVQPGGDVSIGNSLYNKSDSNYKLDINTAGSSGYFSISNGTTANIFNVNSGGNVGIGTTSPTISGTGKLHMAGDTFRLDTARTPASAGAAGNPGEICWDAGFVYVCVALNSWKKAAIAAW